MECMHEKPSTAFKCLVADDSEFARKNITKIISSYGGNVVGEASNGLEAIQLYLSLSPDLVFMDITMPELDGIETLRRIIEKDKNARVIIISSLGHKEMVRKALCLGAKHFVTKPYNPGYLGLIIQAVLSGTGRVA